MTFAKWVFTIGGIWGVLIIGSLFFLEPVIVAQTGPLSHPDTYYGFAVSTFAMPRFANSFLARDSASSFISTAVTTPGATRPARSAVMVPGPHPTSSRVMPSRRYGDRYAAEFSAVRHR